MRVRDVREFMARGKGGERGDVICDMTNKREYSVNFAGGEFTILCLGGFLLSIAYGVTFLIPILVRAYGGNEALAGLIISAATISTVILVILSGHIADLIGSARAVSFSGLFLAISSLGFALSPPINSIMMLIGFILGIGWGVFYTLGPILVAAIIEPERRIKFFALLSGSMMAGIGTGPIIGRIVIGLSMSIEIAFICAGIASFIGSVMYMWLHYRLLKAGKLIPQISKISFRAVREILASNAVYSIIMVGIGGAIFGGLSSFQTSYADKYDFDYSLFFIGFITSAILCRLFLAGYVVKKDPFYTLVILTSLTLVSIILFINTTRNPAFYLATAAILGVGYGLTYSVINGLAANEAPANRIPQSLLLFSLSYFIGVFGFPLVAGYLIVSSGVTTMLFVVLLLAIVSWAIPIFRIIKKLKINNRTTT